MTNILPCLVNNNLSCMLGLMVLVLSFSCSPQGDSNDPIEKLTGYCIRECVLETPDSQICDTECKCAAKKLSEEFSKEEFINLMQNITETKTDDAYAIGKLSTTLEICKTESE